MIAINGLVVFVWVGALARGPVGVAVRTVRVIWITLARRTSKALSEVPEPSEPEAQNNNRDD